MATDKLVDFDHVTDYISREAAIQFFNDWVDDLDKKINDSVNYSHLRSDYKVCKTQLLDCIHAIKEMPAVDVVEVVRCKDCRYFHSGSNEKCCISHKGVVVTDENGYCHHAEKRSDNGD